MKKSIGIIIFIISSFTLSAQVYNIKEKLTYQKRELIDSVILDNSFIEFKVYENKIKFHIKNESIKYFNIKSLKQNSENRESLLTGNFSFSNELYYISLNLEKGYVLVFPHEAMKNKMRLTVIYSIKR